MKYYSGGGLVNKLINKLPFELHIPSYNYCGPGTKLQERLARGDKGINKLDEACKAHDIQYSLEKDLNRRHEADRVLAAEAFGRFRAKDASFGEKVAALGITAAMNAKVKMGMGLNSNPIRKKSSNYKLKFKQCKRILVKTKTSVELALENINHCISLLKDNTIIMENFGKNERSKRKKPPS